VAAVASVFVDEDPERAAALAGPHLRYQQAQYQRWFAEAGDRTSVRLADGAGGLPPGCLVGTPVDVLERIRAAHARVPFTHFSFWMLTPGMAPEVATRSLRLFAAEVLPALRSLGEPAVTVPR
jgi:alkanesulfonate monooxygenase SsuD/methylene tetrahydromethanopterin reductase-like flavin-dependent oxidoreductase (luciferase family)